MVAGWGGGGNEEGKANRTFLDGGSKLYFDAPWSIQMLMSHRV